MESEANGFKNVLTKNLKKLHSPVSTNEKINFGNLYENVADSKEGPLPTRMGDVGARTPLIELICLPWLEFYVCPAIVLVKV